MMVGVALRQRAAIGTRPPPMPGARSPRASSRALSGRGDRHDTASLARLGRRQPPAGRWRPICARPASRCPQPADAAPPDPTGGAGPWATVGLGRGAADQAAQRRLSHDRSKVDAVQARTKGVLTRGDVVKVTITVEATAERNWVVINDPIPAGATIIGDLGGQSKILADQGQGRSRRQVRALDGDGKLWKVSSAPCPPMSSARKTSWRGYFDWVPRGRFVRICRTAQFAGPLQRCRRRESRRCIPPRSAHSCPMRR
jgi:hypothetical protein